MTGKRKCSLLKSIRCKIAEQNGIEFSTPECTFQGECRGTCPKCEEELRYLTEELKKIRRSGGRVAVAGIAATMIATSASGCARQLEEFSLPLDYTEERADEHYELTGDVAYPDEKLDGDEDLEGKVAWPGEGDIGDELTGDVEYPDGGTFSTTGVLAAPVVPEIASVAVMRETEALAALESVTFDRLRDAWQSYQVFLDEEKRCGVFCVGHVTVEVYYDDVGEIVKIIIADEAGEDADE